MGSRIESNIPRLYVYSFFGLLNFYGPIFLLYFQNFSFSLTQIFFFISIYSATFLILDMPMGIVSDYLGRKKTLIVASFFIFLYALTIAVGFEYWQFALAYVFEGVGGALFSGTDKSIMYDSLLEARKKKEYRKINGKYIMFGQAGLIVSALASGYLFVMNFRLPWIAASLAFFVAMVILLTLKEPKRKMPSRKLKHHLMKSFATLRKGKFACMVGLYVVIITSVIMSWLLVQPYYKALGIRPELFGVLLAAGYIITAVTAVNAHKIENRLREKTLPLVAILVFLGYFLSSQNSALLGFVFFYLISFAQGLFLPIIDEMINKRIQSENRATVLSMNSFLANIAYMVVAPTAGYISDVYSVQTTLLLIAVITIVLATFFIVSLRKKS